MASAAQLIRQTDDYKRGKWITALDLSNSGTVDYYPAKAALLYMAQQGELTKDGTRYRKAAGHWALQITLSTNTQKTYGEHTPRVMI
jgi:hypothetical protein